MSGRTVSERFQVSEQEGNDIVNKFWKAVPYIASYQKRCIKFARKNGYIQNYLGRIRRVRFWYKSPSGRDHGFADRTVRNTNVQSIGADLLKIALLRLWKNIYSNPKYMKDCWFISTIHDEVNSCVRKSRLEEILPIIMKSQQISLPGWSVPFTSGIEIGNRWGLCFPFEYKNGKLIPDMKEYKE